MLAFKYMIEHPKLAVRRNKQEVFNISLDGLCEGSVVLCMEDCAWSSSQVSPTLGKTTSLDVLSQESALSRPEDGE